MHIHWFLYRTQHTYNGNCRTMLGIDELKGEKSPFKNVKDWVEYSSSVKLVGPWRNFEVLISAIVCYTFVPANLTELNIPLYSLIFIYGKNVNKKEKSRTQSSRYQRGKDNLFSWPYPIFFYDYSRSTQHACVYMHLLTSGYYRGQCMHLQPYNLENKNRHYLK